MQFLTSVALLAFAPLLIRAAVVKRSIFDFDTFGDTSCQGFQEFIPITQTGANTGNFPGPRKSFLVINSDNDCEAILFTGENFSGTKVTLQIPQVGTGSCFGGTGGEAFLSFDIHCF
ncbi:hypothetical protein CALCODRAFT_520035 [Calocera cornea HHB12733]|uniref:Uncharacterized protein n=1 Tax=Calocera cornea HHB12733 TaxID=1353952 RepID=A0A165DSR8_9BASI|nr:hypothetical protein CALCODRAFT_520035 [Calocera cornea HHB12733]